MRLKNEYDEEESRAWCQFFALWPMCWCLSSIALEQSTLELSHYLSWFWYLSSSAEQFSPRGSGTFAIKCSLGWELFKGFKGLTLGLGSRTELKWFGAGQTSLSKQLLHMAILARGHHGGPGIVRPLTWWLVSPRVSIPMDSRENSKFPYNRVFGNPRKLLPSHLLIKKIARASPDTREWELDSSSQSKEHRSVEREVTEDSHRLLCELTERMHLETPGAVDRILELRPYKEHAVKYFLKLEHCLCGYRDWFLVLLSLTHMWPGKGFYFSVLGI